MSTAGRTPCFEFVAWDSPAAAKTLGSDLPGEPGAVRRDPAGRAELLHIAPRRWLVPKPSTALHARIVELDRAGAGSLIDVEGKWQPLVLRGARALAILESSIDVELVLRERACAAVMLFDCPAIVARARAEFELWVASSYASSFSSAVGALALRDFPEAAS
jgi:sarcosine oxidase gamma subunit